MSIAPEDIQPSFDSNARKYRCCCGCGWHVRVCARIIGSLELVCITIAFMASLIGYIHFRGKNHQLPPLKTDPGYEIWNETRGNESLTLLPVITANPDVLFAIYAFFFTVVWIVVILLFYGIGRIKPKCLLPHLFLQVLSILYTLVMVVVYALQHGKWSVLTFPARPAVIIYGLGCAVEIGFFISVARCYRYLKAKRRASPMARFEKHMPMEEVGAGAPA